ncbi:MAG: hypothetical protein ACRD2T_04685, partial [Thermoanaerobaculia bacterium]
MVSTRPGPGGGQEPAAENTARLTWENLDDYTRHTVSVNGTVVDADVPGKLSSTELVNLPPGPSIVALRSIIEGDVSPEVTTTILFAPGAELRNEVIVGLAPVGIAADPERGLSYALDGVRREVMVLDASLTRVRSFPVRSQAPNALAVMSGIAFNPAGGGGQGSLVVLDGVAGHYQEFSTLGAPGLGPSEVPFRRTGVQYAHLASGRIGGQVVLFTLARGPQNDCILAFKLGSGEPAVEIPHPLSTFGLSGRFAAGGLAFLPGAAPGQESLWLASGLEGEAHPRLLLEVPLGGGTGGGKLLLGVLDQPDGIPEMRGLDLFPERGEILLATSDGRVHVLDDFGVLEGDAAAPEITRISIAGAPQGGA